MKCSKKLRPTRKKQKVMENHISTKVLYGSCYLLIKKNGTGLIKITLAITFVITLNFTTSSKDSLTRSEQKLMPKTQGSWWNATLSNGLTTRSELIITFLRKKENVKQYSLTLLKAQVVKSFLLQKKKRECLSEEPKIRECNCFKRLMKNWKDWEATPLFSTLKKART